MDQQTLTTILTGVGIVLALVGFLRNMKKDLTTQVDKSEAALGTRIGELDSRIGQVAAEARADNRTTREGLGARIDEVKADNKTMREELNAEIRTLREELKADNKTLREELKAEIRTLREELKVDNKSMREGLGARIDKVDAHVAETRAEMRSELGDIRAGLRALEQRFFEILLPRSPVTRSPATGTDDG